MKDLSSFYPHSKGGLHFITILVSFVLLSIIFFRAIQLQIQLGQILRPENLAGPGIFGSSYSAGNDKF